MLIQADARALPLRDESVQCVVTSPPYWGLRDYGTAAQIGLEGTPAAYVEALVAVCRELRRVLRPDGTLWLNLGDSYASSPPGNARRDHSGPNLLNTRGRQAATGATLVRADREFPELALKNLVGIPWRVAFALQADGWLLRSDVIWHKPNPMPESVTDRPTKAHEYVFLLARRPQYRYDAAAIRERGSEQKPWSGRSGGGAKYGRQDSTALGLPANETGRNARTVWTMPSEPYAGAHFATFPTELAKRCILAGCPAGGVVLDPFVGSGTTVRVARDLGRHGVGVDLSRSYLLEQARGRTSTTMGLAL